MTDTPEIPKPQTLRKTPFTPGSAIAKAAARASAAARAPLDISGDAKASYKSIKRLMTAIEGRLFDAGPCKACKRTGPTNTREFIDLCKIFADLADIVMVRGWGQPARQSAYAGEKAIEDFKKARRDVEKANAAIMADGPDSMPDNDQ